MTAWSAKLERQYNMREAFPDHVDYFADWRRRSEAARRTLDPVLDIPYGSGDREKLDVFPGNSSSGAVLVFVHGGYWRTMDKSDFSFLAVPFVSRGITVVLPNYPLCPDVGIDDIVSATRRMQRWVSENIGRYGGDSGEVHLAGWSAGAHLVTMLLTLAAEGAERDPASVLAVSGIYDLRPLKHVRANEDLRITDAVALANSPALLAPARKTRLAVVIGALETSAIHRQAAVLETAWRPQIPDMISTATGAAHHYSIVSRLADESSELYNLALKLVGASGARGPTSRPSITDRA